jgi:hypothetical protein
MVRSYAHPKRLGQKNVSNAFQMFANVIHSKCNSKRKSSSNEEFDTFVKR